MCLLVSDQTNESSRMYWIEHSEMQLRSSVWLFLEQNAARDLEDDINKYSLWQKIWPPKKYTQHIAQEDQQIKALPFLRTFSSDNTQWMSQDKIISLYKEIKDFISTHVQMFNIQKTTQEGFIVHDKNVIDPDFYFCSFSIDQ